MFSAETYTERRRRLREQVQTGLILFLGNTESPMNYSDNPYPFRQDSSFLYFFGLDLPDLAAVIDVDQASECVFGDDLTVDDIIWTGPQPSLRETCLAIGIAETARHDRLAVVLKKAEEQGRTIHFLPQYRPDNVTKIEQLLGIHPTVVQDHVEMQTTAMRMSMPGLYERHIVGAMEGIVVSRGGRPSFPTIFSVHGETLHNHCYGHQMKQGDIAVNDSGAESSLHYASDITRTIPVSGTFSQRQKEIYTIALQTQEKAIDAVKPGVEFRDIHRLACASLASGLRDLGLMRGDMDEAVSAGAHALFFQCGLGHMLGLDVHDMEGLGEDYVGYTETIKRNHEFGWRSLRLARALEPAFVVTVEPGLYFIPELIDRWKAEHKHAQYIDYDVVEKYRDFGGIRIEDDVLVTGQNCRVLGKPIPKTIAEVEAMCSCP
ncbi:MAG: aminopeptidase P family protein [Planctomycetota bacterium]|jgi:Xaa-Pro aminopeptidase